MTSTALLPVGHASLRINDLAPRKSPSYSPNLQQWMRQFAHFYEDGGVAATVYRVRADSKAAATFGAGTLLIGFPYNGYPGDTDFSGITLMSVLCQGSAAGKVCYSGITPDIDPVEGFWDRYLLVGRCAIDPNHQEHFIAGGERYRIDGDHRTCLWCGTTQQRVLTERIVYDESWI